MSLRRFQAPSCKLFWHTTDTNTSNIDFCRTYHAFSKVLGTPRAPHFSWSTNTRSQWVPPNPQKRLKGAHILISRRFRLHLVSIFGPRLTQTLPTSIFVGPTMHFRRFWRPHGLFTSPGDEGSFAVGTPGILKNVQEGLTF